jgi:hypothetical protein
LQAQSSHLREKNIAYPNERSKMHSIFKLAVEDMRFSMKMMRAPEADCVNSPPGL